MFQWTMYNFKVAQIEGAAHVKKVWRRSNYVAAQMVLRRLAVRQGFYSGLGTLF
jgi:hypothetical protein